jgi:hypothetical protein
MSDLKTITTQISEALSSSIDPLNTAQVTFKINKLTLMLAASCHAVAWAERIYSRRMQQLTEDKTWANLSATDKKAIFAGYCRDEAYYLTLTERQNKAIIHALEALKAMMWNSEAG